jgi:amino acid adenylation domain-containing protein
MRVEQLLQQSADKFGAKVAVVAGESRLSYAQLDETASRLANALVRHGVRRDDRVVIFLENSAEAVVALFATLKAGATFSIVNATTKADKLAFLLNNCRPTAVVTQQSLLAVAAQAIDRAPSVVTTVVTAGNGRPDVRGGLAYREALDSSPTGPVDHGGIDIDLAMIIYTSGSTGSPKGVMMTHQNVLTACSSINSYLGNTHDDVILNVLPLSFDYGLYQVLLSCQVGATVVLEKSFAYPKLVLEKMIQERVTGLPLVPTMAALLLQMRSLTPGMFPHLRYLTNTAAALPPAHIERLQALFPGATLFSMYGLTECKRCTYLPPEQLKVRPGSVGKAIPNTEAYVLNEHGQIAKPGEVGELVIRGGHVMKGYWEDPQATARVLRPGPRPWELVLHTGDLFRTDEEGYLYFVGRTDDVIKTRGEKVSPKEVENVLYALEGVREAAVVGVPDPILGAAIKAVVVPARPGCLSEQEVLAHCSRHLESFMVPRYVELRDELPKTETGKIRRRGIQEEARGQL